MPYCIEYTENGIRRYLDEKSRPSDMPYFWKKQTSAESVIRGRLRDGIKYRCVSADNVGANISDWVVPSGYKPPSIISNKHENEKEHNTNNIVSDLDPEELARAVRVISRNIRNLDAMIKACSEQVSKEDRVTQDILHYVEFKKCDAVMISKLYKMLRESRMKRRKNKDLLIFLELLDKTLSPESKKQIMDVVDMYDARTYSPKELHDLFAEARAKNKQ